MPKVFAIADLHLPGDSGKTMERLVRNGLTMIKKLQIAGKEGGRRPGPATDIS